MSLSREDSPPFVYGAAPESQRNVHRGSCRNPPIQFQDTIVHRRPESPRLEKEARTLGKSQTPLPTWDGVWRQTFSKYVGSAMKPELARGIGAKEGRRVPEIFKLANEYGNTVERTPLYRTEVHRTIFPCARLKGGYVKRYEASGSGSTSISFPR